MSDSRKCLTPGCKDAASSRGLCRSCYQAARYLVNHGRASWGELEALGLCAEKATRNEATKFHEALERARKKRQP